MTMKSKENWLIGISWVAAAALLVTAGYLLVSRQLAGDPQAAQVPPTSPVNTQQIERNQASIRMPGFQASVTNLALARAPQLDTIIPTRNRRETLSYTVQFNDSVFGIAEKFNLTPETILWSNYSELQDNPHSLREGMELRIPPTDGIYYRWEEGDSIELVAARFRTDPEKIINWTGNDFDLSDPVVEPGEMVMVPDGKRDFQQWIIPTIARGSAGVSSGVYGSGVCQGPFEGAVGSGAFIWPTNQHVLSGNDYWSGHLAIDIAVGVGMPVYAADSGVVVFSGWSSGGYGNVVIVDHGNGYQTLYAHLNSTGVSCGQSVVRGNRIGSGGSTGNSTGPHLHFEVRFQGGFVNPWFVLPSP